MAYGDDDKTLLANGKLTLIDNAIDQATGTIRLKASFANEDERLWPGEFVNVRLVLNIAQGRADGAGADRAGRRRPATTPTSSSPTTRSSAATVEVAAVQDGIAVITKGLSPGEKVVVDGQYRLTEGARVRIAEPAPGAAG